MIKLRPAFLREYLSIGIGIVFCVVVFGFGMTQEVPVGQLAGTAILTESGGPYRDATVHLSDPNDDSVPGRFAETDDKGKFRFRNVKAGEYQIEVYGSEHATKTLRVQIAEGGTTRVQLKLTPNDPYLKLYASQRVWMPHESPQLEMHGFNIGESVDIKVVRIGISSMLGEGKLGQAISALRTKPTGRLPSEFAKYASQSTSYQYKVGKKDNEGAFINPIKLPIMPEGLYWLTCDGKRINTGTYFSVSKVALVTKTARGKGLAYVTDLTTGKPVKGAAIWGQSTASTQNARLTDTNGICELGYKSLKGDENTRTAFVAIEGGSMAEVGVFTSPDAENTGDSKFVIYTDRPVYRPGDEVQFKGLVRQKSMGHYLPPASGPIKVEIDDVEDQKIGELNLVASSQGAFNGHFSTSKESGPGLYRIVAKGFGSQGTGHANVASYRKPELTVQIHPVKAENIIGDKVQVQVQCNYYFGGPVVGAKVQAVVFASTARGSEFEEDSNSAGGNRFAGGDLSTNANLTTDGKGQAVFEFPTRSSNMGVPLTDLDFQVNVNVTDTSSKYVSADSVIRVNRGQYRLSTSAESSFARPNQTIGLVVKTTNPLTGLPVPNRDVALTLYRESWEKNKAIRHRIDQNHAATGVDGVALVPIKAIAKDSMVIVADSTDSLGHDIRSEQYLDILSDQYHFNPDESKMTAKLDKQSYKKGEIAHLMIRSLVPGGSALVTSESDQLLWHVVTPLNSRQTVVDIPVSDNFTPNCFISVAYVHSKTFFEASSSLRVETNAKKLNISIQSDKPVFHPGDEVKLALKTTDEHGAPVPAEVSVGVVDESIYAIHADSFDILDQFYPQHNNSVTTNFSFAEVYLDGGDKGGGNIPLRKKFLDTASWIPSIQTDGSGRASVNIKLPDNLTEWRATAVGISTSTTVGKATTKFKARKDLMVRLEMPDYMVQQDSHQLAVIVNNDSGKDQDVHVSVSADGVDMDGPKSQLVHVSTGAPSTVSFTLNAKTPGMAKILARAWTDDHLNDGVQQPFQILAHGAPVKIDIAEEVKGSKQLDIPITGQIDRTTGRLRINVSASLAGDLLAALDGLVDFPYGCVEQTMSRFMPSILVSKALADLHIAKPKLADKIPKIARDSITRLSKMRHQDGAWGWWENDQSDPFMTALVLDGLDRCHRAGFAVDAIDVAPAIKWAIERTTSKKWKEDELRGKCYLIYALARYGKVGEATAAYTRLNLRDASSADISTLVLATNEMGPHLKAERDKLLDRLMRAVRQTAIVASWPNSNWEWGSEGTALGLSALIAVRPTDPMISKIVRFLMLSRHGAMWDSTRDTAYSLIGLTQYLARTHDLSGPFDARVYLNGRSIKSAHLNPLDPNSLSLKIDVPTSDLVQGKNTVRVDRSGGGTCYATLGLVATAIQAVIPEEQPVKGLRIVREFYRMEVRKLEDGTLRLMPERKPVNSVHSGELLKVVLNIDSDQPRQFVMIEDPTPCNCRVIEREETDFDETWAFWWDRIVVRDEKTAFFIRNLPKGKQTITYNIRAEGSGVAHALPANLTGMYDLTTRATSGETLLEVK